MAEKGALIRSLLHTVKETVFYQNNRLHELQFKEYPFETSKDFIEIMSKIHEEILDVLNSFESEISEKEEEIVLEQVLAQIQRYGQLVGALHSILHLLEMGSREYISQGSVVLIESIMQHFSPASRFVLIPMYEYNYTYQDLIDPLKTMLKDVLPQAQEFLSAYAEKFAVFGFPLVQRENAMLNSLLAHEVGHFINEEKQIVRDLMRSVRIDVRVVDQIARDWSRLPSEEGEIELTYFISPTVMRAEIHKMATAWISNWLKELVSDMIAFHLFGPVYLFALTNFLCTLTGLDEESGDYPPPRMRIQLLLEEFNEMGYPEALIEMKTNDRRIKEIAKNFTEIAGTIKEFLSAIEEKERARFPSLIHASVTNVIPEVRRAIHRVVKTTEYNPQKFIKEVLPLTFFLDSFVPPVELTAENPAPPISILNVGMLYQQLLMDNLYKMLKAKTPQERLYARHKLHQLVLKALELSDIQYSVKKAME